MGYQRARFEIRTLGLRVHAVQDYIRLKPRSASHVSVQGTALLYLQWAHHQICSCLSEDDINGYWQVKGIPTLNAV